MANRGPLYGLSKDCKLKAEQKFDLVRARDVCRWIEDVLRRRLCDDVDKLQTEADFSALFKDGVALCELMNAIQPGAIRKINKQKMAFKQMENIELFTRACVEYGVNQMDVFQVPDLYETKAMYTVFNCLHALGSLALKKGFAGPNYGVKIADKHIRHFTEDQLKEGRKIIPKQAGTNTVPSQAGMSPYGLSRQIVPGDGDLTKLAPESQRTISLQYGTNAIASQSGMTPYGLTRQIVSGSSVSDDAMGSDTRSITNSSDHAMDRDIFVEDNSFGEEEIQMNGS